MSRKFVSKIKNGLRVISGKLRQFGHWYVGQFKGRPWWRKAIAGVLSFFAFVILYFTAVYFNFFWLFGKSPSIYSIMNPETDIASEVYSDDGQLIGKYFNENRTPVGYNDINPVFYRALIDTEDERFYQHWGVDFRGLFSAGKDMMHGHARGASTITQQLVKNMFRVRTQYSTGLLGHIPGLRIVIMKSKEWAIAVALEVAYRIEDIFTSEQENLRCKQKILLMYANTVDFGSNAYGIKTAAKTYFNTTPKNLTTEQAAVLVGLLKATSYYNPRLNPEHSKARRNVVLENMMTHGDLSAEACDSLKQLPIELNFSVETPYDGKALYFREAVADEVKRILGSDCDLYGAGYKIYTSLNVKMQDYAEKALLKQMKNVQRNFRNHWGNDDPWRDENHNVIPHFIEDLAKKTDYYKMLTQKYDGNPDSIDFYMNQKHKVKLFSYDGEKEEEMSSMDSIRYMVKFMHAGLVAMEPATGQVKAWVGDIDFKSWKYDKVRAMRQPGSTFKLFVYTEAMNRGIMPCDRRRDEYFAMDVYDKRQHKMVRWAPTNANGNFSGDSIPLISAFAQSINSIAVRLGQEVGIGNIINTAHAMGIKSPLDNTPSLALGASDVTLLELVDAYCTIANDGRQHDPVLITKIVDRNGDVIYKAPDESTQAVSYKTAFLMQKMLEGGLNLAGGTSMPLGGYVGPYRKTTDFGGKTGTSNNHSDAWFVGVTPGLVAGAWVGGEYRSIHFRTGALGQGSRTALPIVGYFMQSVWGDSQFSKYQRKFGAAPEDLSSACWSCGYVPRSKARVDSVKAARDSMTFDLNFEEEGEAGSSNAAEAKESKATEPTTEHKAKKEKRKNDEVNFDDIVN